MSRRYDKSHKTVPVTVVLAIPNTITALKNTQKDGYCAIQIGAGTKKHLTKPVLGQFKTNKVSPAIVREFRVLQSAKYQVGQSVAADQFKAGDIVRVTARSKGKGYAGVMKRHGFHGGPKSHGSDQHRAPGSIGAQQPQRVPVGKKMPGHMGATTVTMTKVKIFDVVPSDNAILLQGAIPGPKKGWVMISQNSNRKSQNAKQKLKTKI